MSGFVTTTSMQAARPLRKERIRRERPRPPRGTDQNCQPLLNAKADHGTFFISVNAQRTGDALLLHTDLHAGNVLAAEREPWLAIDPKPYVGDPAYDVTQHIFNGVFLEGADAGVLAARMARLLDLDHSRILLWLFARSVEASPYWAGMADLARTLGSFLT